MKSETRMACSQSETRMAQEMVEGQADFEARLRRDFSAALEMRGAVDDVEAKTQHLNNQVRNLEKHLRADIEDSREAVMAATQKVEDLGMATSTSKVRLDSLEADNTKCHGEVHARIDRCHAMAEDVALQTESLFESLNIISLRMETAETHNVSLWEMRKIDEELKIEAMQEKNKSNSKGWFLKT